MTTSELIARLTEWRDAHNDPVLFINDDVIFIVNSSLKEANMFTVCYRDDKGEAYLLQDKNGSYCDGDGKLLNRDSLAYLGQLGAIG